MAGEIFGVVRFQEPLNKLGFFTPTEISMAKIQNAARFRRREPNGIGKVSVSRDKKTFIFLSEGENGSVVHSPIGKLGNGNDLVT